MLSEEKKRDLLLIITTVIFIFIALDIIPVEAPEGPTIIP